MLYILEPSLLFAPHILKYFFDFKDRFNKNCDEEILLNTCDIKNIHEICTNINHKLFLKVTGHWVEK